MIKKTVYKFTKANEGAVCIAAIFRQYKLLGPSPPGYVSSLAPKVPTSRATPRFRY